MLTVVKIRTGTDARGSTQHRVLKLAGIILPRTAKLCRCVGLFFIKLFTICIKCIKKNNRVIKKTL
ncbi:hypothetical protein HMPREF9554_00098 [Treponema phagedenis F0421]|nr:hypothetical protein HMPREF9554_00098 [Treponema phagedenis F0421]